MKMTSLELNKDLKESIEENKELYCIMCGESKSYVCHYNCLEEFASGKNLDIEKCELNKLFVTQEGLELEIECLQQRINIGKNYIKAIQAFNSHIAKCHTENKSPVEFFQEYCQETGNKAPYIGKTQIINMRENYSISRCINEIKLEDSFNTNNDILFKKYVAWWLAKYDININ